MRANVGWLVMVVMVVLVVAGCGKAGAPVAPTSQTPTPVPIGNPPGPYLSTIGEPSWSPDGTRIAYTRWDKGQVWVYSLLHNTDVYATNGWSPSWSPDGTSLVVNRSGAVYVVDLASHTERMLVDEEMANIAWSPDGRLIAMQTIPGVPRIFVIGADGAGLTCIATGARQPCWSADGTKILHVRWIAGVGWQPFTMSSDSSNVQQLSHETHAYDDLAWSRDGRFIAWDDTQDAIYVSNSDGTDDRKIRSGTRDPEWSPSGLQIACTLFRPDIGMTYLAVMNADGSNPRYLTGSR